MRFEPCLPAMFERPHHRQIARLLGVLDGDVLLRCHCLFGGGTAMALRFGEYRESVDVDFLVSDEDGYRELRQLVRGQGGIGGLVRDGVEVPEALREVRVDHYGIRTRVAVEGVEIKFEIVREARITLDAPHADDRVCGIATLTVADMATSKLLANSDRGMDDGTFSRDLIDLAMMAPGRRVLVQALAKAEAAYGRDVRGDLDRSLERLRDREGRMEHCMKVMGMDLPKALLWQRLHSLQQKVAQLP